MGRGAGGCMLLCALPHTLSSWSPHTMAAACVFLRVEHNTHTTNNRLNAWYSLQFTKQMRETEGNTHMHPTDFEFETEIIKNGAEVGSAAKQGCPPQN